MDARAMIVYAVAAMLSTSLWATILAASPCTQDTLRCALVVAGVIAAMSFLVIDVKMKHTSVLPGVVLVVYQCLLAMSFSERPVSTQAIVNCNTVVLVLHSWYMKPATMDWTVGLASLIVVAASAHIAKTCTPTPPDGKIHDPAVV